jgi:5-methylcytosine-specific restriction enzyme A
MPKPLLRCTHPLCPGFRVEGRKYCKNHLPEDDIKPKRECCICHVPLDTGYFCDKHISMAIDNSKHNLGGKWRRIRNAHIYEHPYCEVCLKKGYLSRAMIVDHIVPREAGGSFYSDNLQSLCLQCNEIKSKRELSDIRATKEQIDSIERELQRDFNMALKIGEQE